MWKVLSVYGWVGVLAEGGSIQCYVRVYLPIKEGEYELGLPQSRSWQGKREERKRKGGHIVT